MQSYIYQHVCRYDHSWKKIVILAVIYIKISLIFVDLN